MKSIAKVSFWFSIMLLVITDLSCFAQDVGVMSVLSPNSSYALGTAEIVEVQIHNYGTVSVSNIPVLYSVNGILSPVEYVPGPIAPSGTYTYAFTATADLHIYNYYNICAGTLYPGDQNPQNDSSCKMVAHENWVTDTIWPLSTSNWTGTVEGPASSSPYTLSQNSLINFSSGNVRGGWAKFPLFPISYPTMIKGVELHWFNNSVSGTPLCKINRLTTDPLLASPVTLWDEISTGYNYSTETSCSPSAPGWNVSMLGGGQIISDIYNSSSNTSPWWACGFYEYESQPGNESSNDGWNQINRPYLIIKHIPIIYPHDVGVVSLLIPPNVLAGTSIFPQAIVRNIGSTDESFTVTMTGPGGYTSTVPVNLFSMSMMTVTFAPLTLPAGPYCFTACANLPNDQDLLNQCKTQCVMIDQTLTQAFGYVLNDPCGAFQKGPVKFYLEHPESLTQIAVNTFGDYLVSGTWGLDPSGTDTWYATEIYNPPLYNNGYLIKIDTTTGAYTNVGQLGINIDGISYDYPSQRLWGIGSTLSSYGNYELKLYEINQTTGQAVIEANLGNTHGKVQGLACHANGMLYFVDTGSDEYFSIDPDTHDKEKIGKVGMDFSHQQDMEFNRADGRLYIAGHDSLSGTGGLYKVNTANGMSSLVNNFPDGLEITGFAIPYTPVVSNTDIGIMRIEYPKTGSLTNAEFVTVKVRNYGNTSLLDYNISVQVGTGPVITMSWAILGYGTFIPGNVISIPFSNNLFDLSTPGATYCIRAWVWGVPADVNQANDSTEKCVTNTSCILANPCYPNSQPEPEICYDYQDDGCDISPTGFVNLVSGDAWCGTVWKSDTLFDKDWYKFTITTPKTIRVSAKAEFLMDLDLVSLPCSNSTLLLSKVVNKCTEDSLVYPILPAGTYAIRIRPDITEYDIICGFSNQYSMKFQIDPPQPTIQTTVGSLNWPCPGNYDIPILVDSCYKIQQIHYNITLSPGISLVGYNNLNPVLNISNWTISQNGSQILVDWYSPVPVSPGNGLLVNLVLSMPPGTSTLTWTGGPDSSYYANADSGYLNAGWIGSTYVVGNCSNLSGDVYYARMIAGVLTPKLMGNFPNLDSIVVQLFQGNTLIDTARTNYFGHYSFTNLAVGNYILNIATVKKIGGINSIDAQMIQMNFVQFNNFSLGPIFLGAGDVNGVGSIPNSTDAFMVMKHFVGLIPTFVAGTYNGQVVPLPGKPDWYSESPAVTITGNVNVSQDIYVLCTGDVDGSYNPGPPPKTQVRINHDGSITAIDGLAELPVYAEQAMNVGSVSLVLNYPPDLHVLAVIIQNTPDNLVYLAKDGRLRLAWYSLEPSVLKQGDVLLRMKVKVDQLAAPAVFRSTFETILSDGLGNIIEGASLSIPKIVPSGSLSEIGLENVPNPFSTVTEIRYALPVSGKISLRLYNVLGESITTIFEGEQSDGSHSISFDGTALSKGVYFYKLQTEYGTKVRTMVISN